MLLLVRPLLRNGFAFQHPILGFNRMFMLSKFHFSSNKEVKVDRGDPKRFNLVQRKVDKAQKVAPSIREDLNKKLTHFDELNQVNIFENKSVSPDAVVKQIDSSFESFFH
jgi:hypothetical protein